MSDQYDDGFYDGESSKQQEVDILQQKIDKAVTRLQDVYLSGFDPYLIACDVIEILEGSNN